MNSLSQAATKTFNLLCIGQRGVGKTVFLAGSYAELHSTSQADQKKLWFDCQNRQAQENLESILGYIARTGQYPPPTMKITDFNFSLKRRGLWGIETLCHFRWWDIPGELCDTDNTDFQTMVLTSHGCCVFINADSLVHDQVYLKTVESVVNQAMAIASLVSQHRLKYPFALILTKCDLLEPGPLSLLQIEEKLQPFITRLDAVKANYQRFYSAIPIVSLEGTSVIKPTGAAAPLLWLVAELRQSHGLHSQQDLASSLMQSLPRDASRVATAQERFGLSLLSTAPKNILILAGIGLIGIVAAVVYAVNPFTLSSEQAQTPEEKQIKEYEQVLQREPNNSEALISLANLYIQLKQPNQAIPLMEKLAQQQPENLDLQLNLAQLYELAGQKQQAETVYDQILAQQQNHLMALISKAVLRTEQGDTQTAKALFTQAEQVAPSDFKPRVREIAQNTLQSTTGSAPSVK